MMKYVFVINPRAGEANSEYAVRKAIENSEVKNSCEIYITQGVEDATVFVRDYCEKHPDETVRFIACGGDGTLSEVFNGAVGHENAEVSCYPCGSGNDFVKAYGGPEKFFDINKVIHAKAEKIDLLKVGDRYSNNVVNFGFDTTVAITVNEGREKNGNAGKNLYTKGIVKALINSMRNRFKVTADGELLNPEGVALLCTLSNGRYVGGSFKCAPLAELTDGYMEVCLVKPISRLRFVSLLGVYTRGEHINNDKFKDIIVYRRAKKVEVEAPEGFAFSLDGEIIYQNRFTVEVVPLAVKFAAPEL